MIDPTPTTRAERRAAVVAWRGVPFRTRAAVLRAAGRGHRHPDGAAAAAAEQYARVALRPRGPRWWQYSALSFQNLGVLVGAAAVLTAEGALLIGPYASAVGWFPLALGGLIAAYVLFLQDLRRDALRILGVTPPADHRSG